MPQSLILDYLGILLLLHFRYIDPAFRMVTSMIITSIIYTVSS